MPSPEFSNVVPTPFDAFRVSDAIGALAGSTRRSPRQTSREGSVPRITTRTRASTEETQRRTREALQTGRRELRQRAPGLHPSTSDYAHTGKALGSRADAADRTGRAFHARGSRSSGCTTPQARFRSRLR